MSHPTPLIATIAAAIGLAFILGVVAHRLRVSPLIGFLLAGVAIGPFTPGFVADQALATELAEIGVILLMFGVGLHFSLDDLLSVRSIAIPGALAQMAASTLMGMGLGHAFGWPLVSGFVFGLALSVASTVVVLRTLQERRIVDTRRGHIAVGWLVIEDLAMVLALVLLPVLAQAVGGPAAGAGSPWAVLAVTLGKVAAFILFMLVVGKRVIPAILHYVAHTGSRELFRLAVLAIALGVALGATTLFGVSFALGAFFAGMILAESELSQRAAEETLPLRDAFAVLFFVSIGMLFDPAVLVEQPWPLLGTVAVIVIGTPAAAFLIIRGLGQPRETARTVAASMAQIGEFSYILAGLGVALGLLPGPGRDLVLAASILSILVNPLVFRILDRLKVAPRAPERAGVPDARDTDLVPTALTRHTVVVGYGRVGEALAAGLAAAGHSMLVVDDRAERAQQARGHGIEALVGNAAAPAVLRAAAVASADRLFVAIPNGFEAGQVIEQARQANPDLHIVVRAHSDEDVRYLKGCGADGIVLGERELARGMLDYALSVDTAAVTAGAAGDVTPVPAARAAVSS